LVLALAAALLVQAVNLNRYRRRVREALRQSLGRSVEVGDVHLQILPWPGRIAENVVIGEVPSIGAEPFAGISELRPTLRLFSLLTGKPVFSSVVFVEPSVNVSREHFAGVNGSSAVASRDFPYLEVRDGRVNFKDGDLKQVFYFKQVDGALFRDGDRL